MSKKNVWFFLGIMLAIFTPVLSNAASVATEDVSYNLGAFGDINYATGNRERKQNSFYLGKFDLYGTAAYERMSFLTEITIEFEDAATEVEAERLWVGYTLNDLFIIRAGRHHASMGYWNRTYHHGRQLFTTVERPFVVNFEEDGGIIPMHIVGIEFEGTTTTELMKLKYEFQIGNGPRITTEKKLGPNSASDDNPSKQIILRLSGAPAMLPGFTLGVFGTNYEVSPTGQQAIEEKVAGLDLSYVHGGWELLGEYYRLWNSDKGADLFYLQAAYLLSNYSLTPYIRYESMNVENGDPYITALGGRNNRGQEILGVRYDINARSSIKTQYRRDEEKGSDIKNVFEVQWAFGF
ncbi:MAG: hypothetical protein HY026_09865 [Deltaproteobacteria bacterium]|nr:hypothetical protein [Deltaproteobacteria bacterium]